MQEYLVIIRMADDATGEIYLPGSSIMLDDERGQIHLAEGNVMPLDNTVLPKPQEGTVVHRPAKKKPAGAE